MKLSNRVRPITYLKNNAAELVRQTCEERRPVIVTQNGEAKVVVMDVQTYDDWRDTLSILRLIAEAEADVSGSRTVPQAELFASVRADLREGQ
jgi:prevent-host-death family protein